MAGTLYVAAFSTTSAQWFSTIAAAAARIELSSPLIYPLHSVFANARGRSAARSGARIRPKLRNRDRRRATIGACGAVVKREIVRVHIRRVSAKPRGVPRPNRLRITSPRFAALACNR